MSTKLKQLTYLQHRRVQGGELIAQGYDNQEVADMLGCGYSTVKAWRSIVKKQGITGLTPQARPGRPPKIAQKHKNRLKKLLEKGAMHFGYPNAQWTSRRVAQLIREKFNVSYSKAQTCRILRALGYSPKKPVRRSVKYSAEAVERWRQCQWPIIKKKLRTTVGT